MRKGELANGQWEMEVLQYRFREMLFQGPVFGAPSPATPSPVILELGKWSTMKNMKGLKREFGSAFGTLGTPYATRMQRTGIGQRIDV
ncbi:MAG: hypothetical protein DMG05_09080 [Acidobacteria bacterium]|nr:MAG: hypothetical protein DMG05_09080 [Acidobacteriota bacterium]